MHPLEDSFRTLADSLGAIMDEMMSPSFFRSCAPDTWRPAVNVYELPGKIIACVELAGIKAGQLDVQIEANVLHIRGYRPKPAIPESEGPVRVHLMEIDSGKFHRKIALPADLAGAASEARYEDGYLWIILTSGAADRPEQMP